MVFTITNPPPGYYVYFYLRSDGTPYYVGKGTGSRAWQEHRDIQNRRGIWTPKENSRIIIFLWDISNEWSLIMERYYIRWFGRKDLGTGILRNKTDGGDGLTNPSEELKRQIGSKSGRPQKKGEESNNYKKFSVKNVITGETFLAPTDDPVYRQYPYESCQKGLGLGVPKPGTAKALTGRKRPDHSEAMSGKGNGRYDPTVYEWEHIESGKRLHATGMDLRTNHSSLSAGDISELKSGRKKVRKGWKLVGISVMINTP